jgi:hypothetical protein
MHGLINRALQGFLTDTYGSACWAASAAAAGLPADGLDPLHPGDSARTDALMVAAAARTGRPREALLEDLGTWLIFGRGLDWLRRLLRFGGVGFVDFLHSLDDLPGRARLALPDLVLPPIEVTELSGNRFRITTAGSWDGFGHILVGALRAMADDYGALAMLDHDGRHEGAEVLSVELLDQSFAEGRGFQLAAAGG